MVQQWVLQFPGSESENRARRVEHTPTSASQRRLMKDSNSPEAVEKLALEIRRAKRWICFCILLAAFIIAVACGIRSPMAIFDDDVAERIAKGFFGLISISAGTYLFFRFIAFLAPKPDPNAAAAEQKPEEKSES
jgi:hypothetical protein